MKNPVKTIVFIVVVITIVAGAYYEISNNNIGSKLISSSNTGNLDIYVTNSSVQNNVSAVYMSFTTASLYEDFHGWTNYTMGVKTVNILSPETPLGALVDNISLSPQTFSAVGLNVNNVTATINGVNKTLYLASNSIIVSHSFSVSQHKTTSVSIEFNLGSDLNLKDLAFTPNIQSSINSTGSNGMADFYVYDSPAPNVSAVYLTFSEISVHGVNTGWSNYTTPVNETINILNRSLANASLVGSLNLSAQQYTMIRLYLNNVTVTINGVNETFNISAPYAFINHPFNVTANGTVNVSIQFNLKQDLDYADNSFNPFLGKTVTS